MALIWNRSIEWDCADWRERAACRDTDPDLFFPIGSTGLAVDQIRAAKLICESCEARQDCLEFALISNQESGVWGGATEDERRRLRRTRLSAQRQAS